MKNTEQQIKEGLDDLLAKTEMDDLLEIITTHVKNLEYALCKVKFLTDQDSVLFEVEDGYKLGYDFGRKRILCGIENSMIVKPLLEHKYPVRQRMFEHLPQFLKIMKRFR